MNSVQSGAVMARVSRQFESNASRLPSAPVDASGATYAIIRSISAKRFFQIANGATRRRMEGRARRDLGGEGARDKAQNG